MGAKIWIELPELEYTLSLGLDYCELLPDGLPYSHRDSPVEGTVECEIFAEHRTSFALPPKAVRTFFHEEIGQVYRTQDSVSFLRNDFLLSMDLRTPSLRLQFAQDAFDVKWFFGQGLRWLVSSHALRRGRVFIPGHCVQFSGKSLLFYGLPECGLYPTLNILNGLDPQYCGNNLFINEADCTPSIFPLGIAGPREEMDSSCEIYSAPAQALLPALPPPETIDMFLMVRAWAYEETEIQEMEPAAARNALLSLCRKFYRFFSDEQLAVLSDSYLEAALQIPQRVMYLGSSESSTVEALTKLVSS